MFSQISHVPADNAFESIKDAVKFSELDYLIERETAYSATIKVRKQYLKKYSDSSRATSTPVKQVFSFPPPALPNQSKQLEDVRQELVKTILENGKKVKTLEENLDAKQSTILNLERKCEERVEEKETIIFNLNKSLEEKNLSILNLERKVTVIEKEKTYFKKNRDMKEKKKSVDLKAVGREGA